MQKSWTAAIGTDLDVGGARFAGMGMGGCFSGRGWAWAIVVVAVDGVDIVLVVDGGGARGDLIRGLMLAVGVRCTPSGALGAAGCA